MKAIALVFLGGGIGSVLRFIIGIAFNGFSTIPYGTFIANIIGSILIGVILGVSTKSNLISEEQTLLIASGFCGGLTTFSTFVYENNSFLKSGDYLSFFGYSLGSFVFGLIAVLLGLYLSK